MNLNAIAASVTRAITPPVPASLSVSTGYTTAAGGRRTPTYATAVAITADVQDLLAKEIEHLDALNITGVERSAYVNANVEGIDRAAGRGGDLITFGTSGVPASLQGTTWLVTIVLEAWDSAGWSKVGLTRQV